MQEERTEYYDNGQLKRLYHVVTVKGKELADGICEEYYEDGSLKSHLLWKRGHVVNGSYAFFSRDGSVYTESYDAYSVSRYDAEGTLLETGAFYNFKPKGVFKIYYKNGNLRKIIKFHKGKKHGICQDFYENGDLKRSFRYVNGHLEGKTVIYHQNGMLRITYIFSKGYVVDGVYENLKNDGTLDRLEEWKDGNCIATFADGRRWEYTIFNGGFDGFRRCFYPNGKLMCIEFYKYGKKHGPNRYFDDKGNLLVLVNYRYGKPIANLIFDSKGHVEDIKPSFSIS